MLEGDVREELQNASGSPAQPGKKLMNSKDNKAVVGILVLLVILWAVASSRAQDRHSSSNVTANPGRGVLKNQCCQNSGSSYHSHQTGLYGSER